MLELQHERSGLRSNGMDVQTAVTGYRSFLRLAQAGLQCNLFAMCQVFSTTKNLLVMRVRRSEPHGKSSITLCGFVAWIARG